MSVAIGRLFTTAMSGKSKERPELAEMALPLTAKLPVIAARGGEAVVRRLFEPLGYAVHVETLSLDGQFPEWGESPYVSLELSANVQLQTLLTHLYVLIPVLDNEKHYWVGEDEIEKLLKRGEGWLSQHPEKELIVQRYLKRQRSLTREALERLTEDDLPEEEAKVSDRDEEEQKVERPLNLNERRMGAVLSALRGVGAKRVLDLGCGEGKLLRSLLSDHQFEHSGHGCFLAFDRDCQRTPETGANRRKAACKD
jgi:3' terminal RNA ribose 2'-O-methyltransferase Hen1